MSITKWRMTSTPSSSASPDTRPCGRSSSLAAYPSRVRCAPCAVALPIVDSFREEFSEDEFAVLAVNVDSDPKKARTFLKRRPVGYPSVSDPKGALPTKFGVETMPTSFLIDREGVIRVVHRGFKKSDSDALRSEIRKLVSGR